MGNYDKIIEKYLGKESLDKSKIIEKEISKEKNKPNIFTPIILLFKFDIWFYKKMLKFLFWYLVIIIPIGLIFFIGNGIYNFFTNTDNNSYTEISEPNKEEINNEQKHNNYIENKKSEKEFLVEELKKISGPIKVDLKNGIYWDSLYFEQIDDKYYTIYNYSITKDIQENFDIRFKYNLDKVKWKIIQNFKKLKYNNLNGTKEFIDASIKYDFYTRINIYKDGNKILNFDISPEELKNIENIQENDIVRKREISIGVLNHNTNLREEAGTDGKKIRILKKGEYVIYDKNYSETIGDNDWTLVKTINNEEGFMITETIDFVRPGNTFTENELCPINSYMENGNCVCLDGYNLIYDKNGDLSCQKFNKQEIINNLAIGEVTDNTNLRKEPGKDGEVIRIIKKGEKVLYTHNYMRIKNGDYYWINVMTEDDLEGYMITDTVNFLNYVNN